MAQDHKLQQQRFELKYLIEEDVAQRLRTFLSSYLEVDDYGVGRPGFSYPIHNLYLDSDDLKLHYATVNGIRNRFKLRLRYYDDRPGTPVFCEIKGRADGCIVKQRCGVHRDTVASLVAGRLPRPESLWSKDSRHWATLQQFNLRLQQFRVRPKALNCYQREAWVSPHDNTIRVTFDRDIRIEPCFTVDLVTRMTRAQRLSPEHVILEVKFTERFPNWFNEMIQCFNLVRSAFGKYSTGVLMLGEHRFRGNGQTGGAMPPRRETDEALAEIED